MAEKTISIELKTRKDKVRWSRLANEHGEYVAFCIAMEAAYENNKLEKKIETQDDQIIKLKKQIERLKEEVSEKQENIDAASSWEIDDAIDAEQTDKEEARPEPVVHVAAPTVSNPDIVSALSNAIGALTEQNSTYARENKRLLEIVNFSEYDERISKFKEDRDIAELLKSESESQVEFLKKENTDLKSNLDALTATTLEHNMEKAKWEATIKENEEFIDALQVDIKEKEKVISKLAIDSRVNNTNSKESTAARRNRDSFDSNEDHENNESSPLFS